MHYWDIRISCDLSAILGLYTSGTKVLSLDVGTLHQVTSSNKSLGLFRFVKVVNLWPGGGDRDASEQSLDRLDTG
jgi:hypothetical protein